jgi:hypothetical protein
VPKKLHSDGEFWSDKTMDLANLGMSVLVFGQLITTQINWYTIALGFVLYAFLVVLSKLWRVLSESLRVKAEKYWQIQGYNLSFEQITQIITNFCRLSWI